MNFKSIMLPQDKASHFVYGTIIAVVATMIFSALGKSPIDAKTDAAIVTAVIGALKEGIDAYLNYRLDKAGSDTPRHGVEFLDWFATSLPGGLLLLLH